MGDDSMAGIREADQYVVRKMESTHHVNCFLFQFLS